MSQFSDADMAHELAKMVFSKSAWLSDFSSGKKKRPDHEIDIKRRELAVLQQAHDHYAAQPRR